MFILFVFLAVIGLILFKTFLYRNDAERLLQMHRKAIGKRAYMVTTADYVFDGDTFKIMDRGEEIRVRLLHIDAPEANQPFGQHAKVFLSAALQGPVLIVHQGFDRYNRLLAEVYTLKFGHSLNMELVLRGMAWVYSGCREYAYKEAEKSAKKRKIGLWKDKNAVNPALWRQREREGWRFYWRVFRRRFFKA